MIHSCYDLRYTNAGSTSDVNVFLLHWPYSIPPTTLGRPWNAIIVNMEFLCKLRLKISVKCQASSVAKQIHWTGSRAVNLAKR